MVLTSYVMLVPLFMHLFLLKLLEKADLMEMEGRMTLVFTWRELDIGPVNIFE